MVNDPITYSEITGNGGCWPTARPDKELGAFVSSSGRAELLSYEPGGDQRDGRKDDTYANNSSISENTACSSERVPYTEYQVIYSNSK